MRILCLVGLVIACVGWSLPCQSDDEKDLYELTLDELMRVKVVSGTPEKISESPGVVSVYYPEQLMKIGLTSMADFLNFATSIEYNYSVSGINPIQIRGLSDANNQKVLFLLDGVPYWMPSHGDIPVNGIPLAAIEKIEVIRGPASVKYGTNSSSGVISVVTKKQQENTWRNWVNSDGIAQTSFYQSVDKPFGHFDFAFEARRDDGFDALAIDTLDQFDPSCNCFPLAPPGFVNQFSEHTSLLGRFQQSGFSAMIQHYEESSGALASGTLLSPTENTLNGTLIALNYEKQWQASKATFYSDWNRYYWQRSVQGILAFSGIPGDGRVDFDNDGQTNYRWRSGVNYQTQLSESVSWLVGAEHETRSTENNKFRDNADGNVLRLITQPPFNLPFEIQPDGSILLIEAGKIDENAILTQLDFSSEQHRLVAGVRYVDNEFSGSHLSPRLSYIYKMRPSESFKLLYAEGFNSPTFRQITARDSFGFAQNVAVQAEVIRSTELAYSVTREQANQVVSLFYTEAKDLIQSSAQGISNSRETITRSGVEYEFNFSLDNFRLQGGVSFLEQGNQRIENDETSAFNSRWLFKSGVYYYLENHSLGGAIRAASKRANVDAYQRLDVSYQYRNEEWEFFLTIQNLTDESVSFPDVRNQQEVVYQGVAERNLVVGFDFNF